MKQKIILKSLGLILRILSKIHSKNCSLYIICNNHPIFGAMPITVLSQLMKSPSVIFDYWNNYSNQRISLPSSVRYIGLGNLGKALSS